MELKSFQRNGISWRVRALGEKALLLEPDCVGDKLSAIHQFSKLIEESNIKNLVDVVPAYDSIGVIFDEKLKGHVELIKKLEDLPNPKKKETSTKVYEIPVCYDLGLDWEELEAHTGRSKDSIIEIHSSKVYTVAMIGFIPGFVFLDGLDVSISCPRKSNPRTTIPFGSVGIGGDQTGIYSLESPGGWNIIGRTLISFFDVNENPPTKLEAGDEVKFVSISEKQFEGF